MTDSPAATLCKACGLCCTGRLFIWVKLRPSELDPAEALGMQVFRADPTQRGFSQPCPLWQGVCIIYTSRHYPRACRAYRCKLLKEVESDRIPLPTALDAVDQTHGRIAALEALLPPSAKTNFRERLVEQLESSTPPAALLPPARALLADFESVYGVRDLLEKPNKWPAQSCGQKATF